MNALDRYRDAAGHAMDRAEAKPLPLASEQVVVAAPMSFAGAAERSWKLTVHPQGTGWLAAARAAVILGVLLLIAAWWALIVCWYFTFGLLLVPYRIIRRGQRKQKLEQLRHEETLAAIYRANR
jgi:hypothetical protein